MILCLSFTIFQNKYVYYTLPKKNAEVNTIFYRGKYILFEEFSKYKGNISFMFFLILIMFEIFFTKVLVLANISKILDISMISGYIAFKQLNNNFFTPKKI